MLALQSDKDEVDKILALVKEEESRNEDIRRQNINSQSTSVNLYSAHLAAADLLDLGDTPMEQSFNREQVQEQEQVSSTSTVCN